MTRKKLNFNSILPLALALGLALTGCAKGFQAPTVGSDVLQSSQDPSVTPTPQPSPAPSPQPTPAPSPTPVPTPFMYKALLWEPVRSGSSAWSKYLFQVIQTDAKALLEADDFNRFCPKYTFLSQDQKVNVAAMLISAIVKFESSFNPLMRYHEDSLGIDDVTGEPVYSEGLMQLSYQDINGYPFCEFDWDADQKLSPTDPKKTILDPYKNLYCGTRILAQQVSRRGSIVLSSGAYWAVIKQGNAYEKIDEIAALVNTLDFCH